MSHFADNLRRALAENQLSSFNLALELGIDPSVMSKVINGIRKPPKGFIEKLATCEPLQLTLETMKGWQALDEYEDTFIKAGLKPVPIWENVSTPQPMEGLYRVPLRGTVAAGSLTYEEQLPETEYIDWYDLTEISSDIFCLKVKGDSMYPPIPDGAYLLVREARQIKKQGIYVIETQDNETTVKVFQYDGRGTRLIPLNPQYPEISLETIKVRRLYEVLEYKVNLEKRLFSNR